MRFSTFAMLVIISLQLEANTPNYSFDNPDEGWNSNQLARLYFHNSEQQRQRMWKFLGKYPFKGNEKVLDFGCGDGKLTAEISHFLPRGEVLGADISAEMIHFAEVKFPRELYPNLSYRVNHSITFSDALQDEKFDRICSFCVFHLIPQPVELLQNLKTHLKPGGKLLLLVPAGKNSAYFQAASETFAAFELPLPWKKTEPSMLTARGAAQILEAAGFEPLSLEMDDDPTIYYDKEELLMWMLGTLTANWNIPIEHARPFFSHLIERMIELDPRIIDDEGHIRFAYSYLYVVAKS